VKPLPFSQDDVNRAIERLTSVLEDEFGNDIAAWGSATLVLLCSIIDMTEADRQEIAELILKQPHHGGLQ
jgi:hypothetical protein